MTCEFLQNPSHDVTAYTVFNNRFAYIFVSGGDQGLLNMFFKDWALKDISKHLSFTYNVVWSSTYSYLPALKQWDNDCSTFPCTVQYDFAVFRFGQNMKIVHFIASSKPWLQSFNTETRLVTATSGGAGLQTLLQLWWDLFCHHVHPRLSTEMVYNRIAESRGRGSTCLRYGVEMLLSKIIVLNVCLN